MDAAGYPYNHQPQNIGRFPERPRSRSDTLGRDFSPKNSPDRLYGNQSTRQGLSRGHGSFSGSSSSQSVSSQLYPVHMQSLAPSNFPRSYPSAQPNHGPGYSPAVHVNRVATLPTHLPQGFPSRAEDRPPAPPPPFAAYPSPPPFEVGQPRPRQSFPQFRPIMEQQESLVQQQTSSPVPYQMTAAENLSARKTLSQPITSEAEEDEDENELALAIALSKKMVLEQQEREEKLRRQEEDEFERALAQSMLETSSSFAPSSYSFDGAATSSRVTLDSPQRESGQSFKNNPPGQSSSAGGTPVETYTGLGRYDTSTSHIPGPQGGTLSSVAAGKQPASPNDESTTAPAASIEGQGITQNHPSPAVDNDPRPALSQEEPEKVFRDMFALSNDTETSRSPSPLRILSSVDNEEGLDDELLTFDAAPISSDIPLGLVESPLERPVSPSELAYYDEIAPDVLLPDYMPKDAVVAPQSTPQSSMNHVTSVRPDLAPLYHSTAAPEISNTQIPFYPPQDTNSSTLERASTNGSANHIYQNLSASSVATLPPGAAAAVPQVVAANQYIDPDLLLGVSIDFKDPVLSAQLKPMAGSVPNIVSLPYGRCLPLHVHAPSWRHLLKLLARMGNTRFEATDTAKAALRNAEIKLRTVVQFVKIHPTGDDWRTILWFTVDHPVPPSLPHANKYINPHPNLLPWSYELINPPRLLRNATDAIMSKTYTIPATESLPYPTIPMTFPNLALYLQAALDFSRQQKDDGNGYRKLSKMVQVCYPHTEEPSDEPPEKKTVGGLFKRVIGRGNKKKTGKTNNEETYEYITPFVPDEWG